MKYFGTDGIRGVAGEDLSSDLAYKTGRALAKLLEGDRPYVVIGTDTRLSRDMIKASISAGLMSQGVDIVDLGIIPTPAVAFFARNMEAQAGIVISASHNPGEFNGIKLFAGDGYKFSDEFEQRIEDLIDEGVKGNKSGSDLGTISYLKGEYDLYNDYLLSQTDVDFTRLKIALDCGHGASSVLAEDLFTRGGAEVLVINDDFNGMDINDECGSTAPGLVRDLVLKSGADVGFAFDGDADRLIVIDEKGNEMNGDHYLAAMAMYMKDQNTLGQPGVVGTVMANIGLARYLESIGLDLITTGVGDRYVMEEMRKSGYKLGGEQSGHFLHLACHTTGCGLLSAVKLLEAAIKTNMKISDLNKLMTSYPQVLINAKVDNEKKKDYLNIGEIKEAIDKAEAGLGTSGRVLIRPSGTEPLIRVMVEGEKEEELLVLAQSLAKLIEDKLA